MTHPNNITNGASLEDSHTNFFALADLCGIKWRRLGIGENYLSSPDPLEHPVLTSYVKCLASDVLCVWRRVVSNRSNVITPGLGGPGDPHHHHHHSSRPPGLNPGGGGGNDPHSSGSNVGGGGGGSGSSGQHSSQQQVYYNKELWIFWYGEEPDLSELLANELSELEQGSWENGLSYECRSLLFKALHNLIEKCLLSKGYARFGPWFVEPLDGLTTETESNSDNCASFRNKKSTSLDKQYSFSFNFFVHGESTVCAALDVREHQSIHRLTKSYLNAALGSQNGLNVILSPYGIAGVVTGQSFKESDPSVQRLLTEWKKFYPLNQSPTKEVQHNQGSKHHPNQHSAQTPQSSQHSQQSQSQQQQQQQQQQGAHQFQSDCHEDVTNGAASASSSAFPSVIEVIVGGMKMKYLSSYTYVTSGSLVALSASGKNSKTVKPADNQMAASTTSGTTTSTTTAGVKSAVSSVPALSSASHVNCTPSAELLKSAHESEQKVKIPALSPKQPPVASTVYRLTSNVLQEININRNHIKPGEAKDEPSNGTAVSDEPAVARWDFTDPCTKAACCCHRCKSGSGTVNKKSSATSPPSVKSGTASGGLQSSTAGSSSSSGGGGGTSKKTEKLDKQAKNQFLKPSPFHRRSSAVETSWELDSLSSAHEQENIEVSGPGSGANLNSLQQATPLSHQQPKTPSFASYKSPCGLGSMASIQSNATTPGGTAIDSPRSVAPMLNSEGPPSYGGLDNNLSSISPHPVKEEPPSSVPPPSQQQQQTPQGGDNSSVNPNSGSVTCKDLLSPYQSESSMKTNVNNVNLPESSPCVVGNSCNSSANSNNFNSTRGPDGETGLEPVTGANGASGGSAANSAINGPHSQQQQQQQSSYTQQVCFGIKRPLLPASNHDNMMNKSSSLLYDFSSTNIITANWDLPPPKNRRLMRIPGGSDKNSIHSNGIRKENLGDSLSDGYSNGKPKDPYEFSEFDDECGSGSHRATSDETRSDGTNGYDLNADGLNGHHLQNNHNQQHQHQGLKDSLKTNGSTNMGDSTASPQTPVVFTSEKDLVVSINDLDQIFDTSSGDETNDDNFVAPSLPGSVASGVGSVTGHQQQSQSQPGPPPPPPSSASLHSSSEVDSGTKMNSKNSSTSLANSSSGSLVMAELARMFPTPPSLENTAPSPCNTTLIDDITGREKLDIYPSSPMCLENAKDWSYVYKPPIQSNLITASKYAPLPNIPSMPAVQFPPECSYKPKAPPPPLPQQLPPPPAQTLRAQLQQGPGRPPSLLGPLGMMQHQAQHPSGSSNQPAGYYHHQPAPPMHHSNPNQMMHLNHPLHSPRIPGHLSPASQLSHYPPSMVGPGSQMARGFRSPAPHRNFGPPMHFQNTQQPYPPGPYSGYMGGAGVGGTSGDGRHPALTPPSHFPQSQFPMDNQMHHPHQSPSHMYPPFHPHHNSPHGQHSHGPPPLHPYGGPHAHHPHQQQQQQQQHHSMIGHHPPHPHSGSALAGGPNASSMSQLPPNYDLHQSPHHHPHHAQGPPPPYLQRNSLQDVSGGPTNSNPSSVANSLDMHSLLVNLVLSDSMLNLFKDHNFESCALCVCNMNIKGSDVGIYLPENLLPSSSDELQFKCTCGFSAVSNRHRSAFSGLFYEDEIEITGILYDPLENRHKKQLCLTDGSNSSSSSVVTKQEQGSSLSSLENQDSNKSTNSEQDQLNELLVDLLKSQCSTGFSSSSVFSKAVLLENVKKSQLSLAVSTLSCSNSSNSNTSSNAISNSLVKKKSAGLPVLLNAVRVVSKNVFSVKSNALRRSDCSEVTFMAMITGKQAMESAPPTLLLQQYNTPERIQSRSTCLHEWPFSNGVVPSNNHHTIKLLKNLQPLLQESVQKKPQAMWEVTYTVSGPLTWRQFHRLAGRGTEDQCEPQPIPSLLVGHDKDWVALSPFGLKFWEKLTLEPYSVTKDIAYIVVAPDSNFIINNVKTFFKELSTTYEMLKLGKHCPMSSVLRDGIMRVGKTTVKHLGDKPVDEWFNQIGDGPVASKLKLYSQACRHYVTPIISSQTLDRSFFDNNQSKQSDSSSQQQSGGQSLSGSGTMNPPRQPGSSPGVAAGAQAPTPGSDNSNSAYESKPSQDELSRDGSNSQSASQQQQQQQQQQQSDADQEEDPNKQTAIVIYIVEPFTFGNVDEEVYRLSCLGLLRCYLQILKYIPESLQNSINLQLISLDAVLGTSKDFASSKKQDQLKSLAFSVYNQCRKTLIQQSLSKSLTGFGPAASLDLFLKSKDPSLNITRMFAPPFILAPLKDKQTELVEISGDRREKSQTLFCSYCLTEDQKWIVVSCVNEKGDLLHSNLINIEIPNRTRRTKASVKRFGLHKIMDFVVSIMAESNQPWRLIIGKLGRVGHGELREWACLLTKKSLLRYSKLLKEKCRQCSYMPPYDMPCIFSACLISLEADTGLRVFPDQFTQDDRYSSACNTCPLSTPEDASCTHILVFPTSATTQSSQGIFPTDPLGANIGEDDLLQALEDDLGVDTGMNDLFNWTESPQSPGIGSPGVPGHPSSPTSRQGGFDSGGHLKSSNGMGGDPQDEPLQLLQQPLALGYYVSTAKTGPLPKWFWSSCSHLEDSSPVFLKSALLIHTSSIQQSNDDLYSNTRSYHSLDSSLTTDVLRYVLEGYNSLSWVSLEPTTYDRMSCLPVHIQIMMQLYHTVQALI